MGATRKHLRRGIVAIIVGVVATVVMSWLAMSTLLFRSFEDAFIDTDFHVIATSDQCVWKSSFLEQYWVTVMLCDLTSNKPDVELDTRDHHRVHLADLAAFPEFIRSRMFLQQEADDVIIIAAGWPMRSLICDTRIEPGATRHSENVVTYGGVQLFRNRIIEFFVIPYVPILPGFIINTLFYATIWLGIALGIGAWRSRRRVRRNRCARCGYSREGLKHSAACPECGTAPKQTAPIGQH